MDAATLAGLNFNLDLSDPAYIRATVTDNTTLIVLNGGSSDNVLGRIYHLQSNSTGTDLVVATQEITAPQFSELGPTRLFAQAMTGVHSQHPGMFLAPNVDGDWTTTQGATGRIESIPLRLSARIKNITENFSTGGEVRFLRYNGGLNVGHEETDDGVGKIVDVMDAPTYLEIVNMLKNTKRSTPLGGKDLSTPHQVNTYPADNIRSASFQDDTSFLESVIQPKFCSLIILIDNFKAGSSAINNTYTLSVTCHRAARFAPGSIHYAKQRHLPAAPDLIAKSTAHEMVKAPTKAPNGVQEVVKGLGDVWNSNPFLRDAGLELAKAGGRQAARKFLGAGGAKLGPEAMLGMSGLLP
jgi:hypothetical protein